MKAATLLTAAVVLLAACTGGYASATPSLSAPAFTAIPTFTSLPTRAIVPTATAGSPPFEAFGVSPWADNVVLRSNPGYLFARLAILNKGAPLLLLGRSRGGEWLFVQTPDNRSGWVFAQLVDSQGHDLTSAPLIQPPSVQTIIGSVRDESGVPISGIQFSFVQGLGSDAPRNDAMTDSTGTFYSYMPPDATGTWSVSYTAVACTSNTMDAACNCKNGVCGKPDPERVNITLPLPQGQLLEFVWK